MKKMSSIKTKKQSQTDLLPEYAFNYTKAKPNRFAGRLKTNHLIVSLDEDLSRFFKNSETVNHVLRTLMQAFPAGRMMKSSRVFK